MRIVLLSLCIALPVAAADRGELARQIAGAEANVDSIASRYAQRLADAEAEVERVRSAGDRERAAAQTRVQAAQAAFAEAYQVRPARRKARGRRLGIVARDVTEALAKRLAVPEVRGALVQKIKYDSEAYVAGMRAGDVILLFDGLPVVGKADLEALVRKAGRGRKLYIEVWRDHRELIIGLPAIEEPRVKRARGQLERARDDLAAVEAMAMERMRTAEASLAKLRAEQAAQLDAARAELDRLQVQLAALNQRFGVKLTPLPQDVASYFEISGGAYVRAVEAGSRAAETGLQTADIVLRFGGQRVRDARHLTELIRATGATESVRVEILRNGATLELTTPGALDT